MSVGYPIATRWATPPREIPDPYRWLEREGEDTACWLAAQAALSGAWLDSAPGRDELERELHRQMAAGQVGAPVRRGARIFYTARVAGSPHAVLVLREA